MKRRSRGVVFSRRRLMRAFVPLASMVLLGGIAASGSLVHASTVTESDGIINVMSKGAIGNGLADDTAAIQSAINALPSTGGTVYLPAGTYLIDTDHPLRLRDRMHLRFSDGAVLVAKPTARQRFYMLLLEGISDVEISGGHIMGERDEHLGSQGEWGYGIFVSGSRRVRIHDIKVSRCWGDGICISRNRSVGAARTGSEDVTLTRVVCSGNRRQGLTIGAARKVRVLDSEFSETGGTSPSCGIDIEPDAPDSARDIQIVSCLLRGNQGCGIQVYRNVSQVLMSDCDVKDNGSYGVLVVGARESVLVRSRISGSGMTGAALRGGATECEVSDNVFRGNGTKFIKQWLSGLRRSYSTHGNPDDIQVTDDTRSIKVAGNTFSG